MLAGTIRRSSAAIDSFRCYLRHWAAKLLVTWRTLAARPVAVTGIIATCSLASIFLITALAGVQEPEVHDELSQLVQADIFAHGRLAEPPHQFWHHFETVHVLSQPHYQSKYPPAPALFMAIGEKATGFPIVGVWISVAILILSMGYAMYGLLPGRWALLGTFLVALRFGVIGDWPHSYWGGAVAGAGGALVLGAIARLRTTARFRDGALFGSGLLLLALSRPYEGFAYSLPAVAILGWLLCRPSPMRPQLWRNVVPALAMVCVTGFGWLAYYNWRVTGSALTLPYVAYERDYSSAPLFVWQKARGTAPLLTNRDMEKFEREYQMRQTAVAQRRWPVEQLKGFADAMWDYLKPALPFAFVGLLFAPRAVAVNGTLAAAPLVSILAALVLSCWTAPRYLAPATASIFALVAMGLAGITRLRIRWLNGYLIASGMVLLLVAAVPLVAIRYINDLRTSSEPWAQKRDVRLRLDRLPGDDLVFVRYSASHNPVIEWVYNGADIDHQPIVWARELDPVSDARLRSYFADRRAWVVLADETPSTLLEWPGRP
jgi:hypothetical protein